MSQVGFEPTISAGGQPQTHALDRAAAGTGLFSYFVSAIPEAEYTVNVYRRFRFFE
jgi:hypothetical protein